jgi:hypothetical protein
MTVVHSSVATVSWIPSEAIEDAPALRAPFEMGLLHYDRPPPATLDPDAALDALADDDLFRFAHRLTARIEVEEGRIVSAHYAEGSGGAMGGTTVRLGAWATRLSGVDRPLRRDEPVLSATSATFRQTYGGHTGLPAPRRVTDHVARWRAPIVWTTLTLTLHTDGRVEFAMPGASRFPRHWVYDPDGQLTAKSAITAFTAWYRGSHDEHTPWGDEHTPALVMDAETDLERLLSTTIMQSGARPEVRSLDAGELLTEQGLGAGPVYVVLDGVLAVEVDGVEVGEIGPGAVVGERAHLEGGRRTATLRAVTRVRCAAARFDQLDEHLLVRLRAGHRREETGP